MTTVSSISRQNNPGLRALTVVLWQNFVVVVLVLESKFNFAFCFFFLHHSLIWQVLSQPRPIQEYWKCFEWQHNISKTRNLVLSNKLIKTEFALTKS